MDPRIGQALGHYRIEAKLGEGGMGVVYRAFDTHLDRPVAIKILRADATTSPERQRRFVQEAKAASALNHPNIIHIYDISSSGDTDFIAMEFVAGKTLHQLIGKNDLPLKDTLKYSIQKYFPEPRFWIASGLPRVRGYPINGDKRVCQY